MRLLVITSCTGSKRSECANALQQADFLHPARLKAREAELADLVCPAEDMYTGAQHRHVVAGMSILRRAGVDASLNILSAGYGLIPGDRAIAPYDVTFSTMGRKEARAWARRLGIPAAVRAAIRPYPLVIFLLGDKYLSAIEPPLRAGRGQRLIFFARPSEGRLDGPGVVVVPTGQELCARYGAGNIGLKGAMFEALARGVATAPAHWLEAMVADESDRTVQHVLAMGLAGGTDV